MCGIAGFSLHPSEALDALALSRSLLLAIETRGRHATGAVWTEDDGAYFHKAGITASRYVGQLPLPPTATVAALHTRFATGGTPRDNNNNHPFSLPGITGIHNGVIRNAAQVFKRLGVSPTTETDSECIFASLAYAPDGTHPTEALRGLTGDAAIAWLETDRPNSLHLARLQGRPLSLGFTPAGSVVFASTLPLLRLGANRAGVRLVSTWDVPAWTYIRVWRGRVQDVRRFGLASGMSARVLPTRVAGPAGYPWSPSGTAEARREARLEAVRDARKTWGTNDPRDHVDPQLRLGV